MKKRQILTQRISMYQNTGVSNEVCLEMMRTSVGLKYK